MTIKDLQFSRIYDWRLVPRYLLEQIPDADEGMIDRIYQNGNLLCNSPMNFLYVLTDDEHKIKGVLWAVIDVIEACWLVRVFSVDKEYNNTSSENIQIGTDFILNIPVPKQMNKKIWMLTSRPKAFERAGWNKVNRTRMEYENVEQDDTEQPDIQNDSEQQSNTVKISEG